MSSPCFDKMPQMPETEAEHEASPGRVFWITGLSGAGKTTLGRELWSRLRAAGRPVTFLDGDALRSAFAEDLGHTAGDRRRSAMRNGRLCRLLAEQGTDVVCATISLFHEVQRWNREHIPGYREIYLRVPMHELRRRDSKGIYAGVQRGDVRDVVGIGVEAEVPEAPDLVLDNYGALDVNTAVDRILALCAGRDREGAPEPARAVAFKPVAFQTKAESLEALAPLLLHGRVLPQVRFSVGEWRSDAAGVVAAITAAPWGSDRVIVRSSARCEDEGAGRSQAGKYDSVLGVIGSTAAAEAIDRVIESFADNESDDDQIFVQPMLDGVAMAGVVFSRSPGGSPWFIVNYDDRSGRTERVTAGVGDNLETFFALNPGLMPAPHRWRRSSLSSASSKLFWLVMHSTWNSPSAPTGQSTFCRSARSRSTARGGHWTRRSTPRLPISRARLNCSAARIPTCTAAGPYSALCRTGTRLKSSGCDPGPSPCRSIASSLPMRSGRISGTITGTKICEVFRCWSAFTDYPTSTFASVSTPSYRAMCQTSSPDVW